MWIANQPLKYLVVEHNTELTRFTPRARFSDKDDAEWFCRNLMRNFTLHGEKHTVLRLIDTNKRQELEILDNTIIEDGFVSAVLRIVA